MNENRNVNLDLLQKRIRDLEEDNKRLVVEATELVQEAEECEAKEEKLVTDAVKHLTEANVQINYLSKKFTTKSDESHKQREEINHLLAQVRNDFLSFSFLCFVFFITFLSSFYCLTHFLCNTTRNIFTAIENRAKMSHLKKIQPNFK